MPKQKFTNFGKSKLAASILSTDTTINITVGDGAKFPTLAAGDYFIAGIINSAKQAEVIKVTARATDQFTAARGQEGTTARAYTAGDTIQLILSRDLLAEFLTRNPPVSQPVNYSTVVYHDGGFHELATGVTQVTLGDAATLRPTTADQWTLRLKNVSSANITIARTTGTDTINRVAGNITLYPGQEVTFTVNAARNGFETGSWKGTRNVWDRAQDVAQVTLTDAVNIATDASLSNAFLVTLGGNRTLDNPTNLVAGQTVVWHIHQDGTGGRTLAFGTSFKFQGGSVPSLITTASAVNRLSCAYNGTVLTCDLGKDYR